MTRAGRVVFAVLALATFGAFFVTQRLKQTPRIVRTLSITPVFSPNADNRRETATIRFAIDKRSDNVTVRIVDGSGDTVRTLLDDRHVVVRAKERVVWNGRTDAGRVAPDGDYRVRVSLRHQGRSVLLLKSIRLDTVAPRPVVEVLGQPGRPGPLILGPNGGIVRFRYLGPDSRLAPRFVVYRSDVTPPVIVTRLRGRAGSPVADWNGRIGTRLAPPGTYFVAARIRDRASNTGTSPPLRPNRPGAPASRPGVTIRALATQPPSVPVAGGARTRFFVDARGASYAWRIRRVGAPHPVHAFRTTRNPVLSILVPRRTGAYLLELSSGRGRHRQQVPFAVRGARRHSILLVLPTISWQGNNPVDDDGNGLPNVLYEQGLPNSPGVADNSLQLARPFVGDGLPRGFRSSEGPLLSFLDSSGLGYDITTDLALFRDHGASLRSHRGIVLAGDPTWLPPSVRDALARRVRSGGRILILGTNGLRRGVLIGRGEAFNPSKERPEDAFGIKPAPLVRKSADLLAFPSDSIGLFVGTDGLFRGFSSYQPVRSAGDLANQVAAAGPTEGRAVIAAFDYGKGLIIRTGLPAWSSHLRDDPNVAAFTERAWTLLGR